MGCDSHWADNDGPSHRKKPLPVRDSPVKDSLVKEKCGTCQAEVSHHHRWDIGSIGLSIFCLIHCLVTPLFTLIIPIFGLTKEIHVFIFFPLLFFAIMAFYRGYCHHRKSFIVIQAATGLFILVMSLFFHDFLEAFGTMLGSLILIGAHIQNIKSCHC